MRKIIALLLMIATVICCFAGCSDKTPETSPPESTVAPESSVPEVEIPPTEPDESDKTPVRKEFLVTLFNTSGDTTITLRKDNELKNVKDVVNKTGIISQNDAFIGQYNLLSENEDGTYSINFMALGFLTGDNNAVMTITPDPINKSTSTKLIASVHDTLVTIDGGDYDAIEFDNRSTTIKNLKNTENFRYEANVSVSGVPHKVSITFTLSEADDVTFVSENGKIISISTKNATISNLKAEYVSDTSDRVVVTTANSTESGVEFRIELNEDVLTIKTILTTHPPKEEDDGEPDIII